jgi:hypothetical protein
MFTIREQIIGAITDYYSVHKKLPENYEDINFLIHIPDDRKEISAQKTFLRELNIMREIIPLARENMYLKIAIIGLLALSTVLSIIISSLLV